MPNMTHEASLIDLARRLIQQRSVTPEDAACQHLIAQELIPYGFVHHTWKLASGAQVSLYHYGEGPGCIAFAGHTDVVPPGDKGLWTHPPYAGLMDAGHIYGRGASDMKGSVACMVTALQRWAQQHHPDEGQVLLMLTSDEEAAINHGMAHLVEQCRQLQLQPQLCWVAEPTSTSLLGDTVKVGRRGSLHVDLEVQGQSGHVAYPQHCDNPVHTAAAVVHALEHADWGQPEPLFLPTSFQCVRIASDAGARNVVPGVCQVGFNLRFAPPWTDDSLCQHIETLLSPWPHVVMHTTLGAQPYYCPPGPLATTCAEVGHNVLGVSAEWSTSGGTSDARFLAELGCEIIEAGPLNHTAHQIDEHIAVRDLVRLEAWMYCSLEALLSKPSRHAMPG